MELSERGRVACVLQCFEQTAGEAELRLTEFEKRWDEEYLPIGQSWRCKWPRLICFRRADKKAPKESPSGLL
jgi:transposase-like protein